MALLISKISPNTTTVAVITLAALSLSSVLVLPRVRVPLHSGRFMLERLDNPTPWTRSRPRISPVLRADGAGVPRVPVFTLRMESLHWALGGQGNISLILTGGS